MAPKVRFKGPFPKVRFESVCEVRPIVCHAVAFRYNHPVAMSTNIRQAAHGFRRY